MSSGARTRGLPKALIFGVGAIAVLQAVAGMGAAVIVADRTAPSEVTLTVGARLVSVKPTPAARSLEGRSGQDLPLGSEVSTNEAGRGEVDYRDGSLVRLAPNTKFSVVSLTKDAGQRQVRSRLDVGGTWHRVQKLTGSGSYVVETPVATASVRGTTFLLSCTAEPACTFTVIDGVVEVSALASARPGVKTDWPPVRLSAGQLLVVKKGGPVGPSQTVPLSVVAVDPFVTDNLRADGRSVAMPSEAERNDFARVQGDWTLDFTVASFTGPREDRPKNGPRPWTFSPECPTGSCLTHIRREDLFSSDLVDGVVAPADGGFRSSFGEETDGLCLDKPARSVTSEEVRFHVVSTQILGGQVVATAIEGDERLVLSFRDQGDRARCPDAVVTLTFRGVPKT